MKNKDPTMLIIETFNDINSITLSGPRVLALFEKSGSLCAINQHIHHALGVHAMLSLSAGSHVWVLFQKTFYSVNILRPLAQAPFLRRQRICCSVLGVIFLLVA